jgi:hypothetical protein
MAVSVLSVAATLLLRRSLEEFYLKVTPATLLPPSLRKGKGRGVCPLFAAIPVRRALPPFAGLNDLAQQPASVQLQHCGDCCVLRLYLDYPVKLCPLLGAILDLQDLTPLNDPCSPQWKVPPGRDCALHGRP